MFSKVVAGHKIKPLDDVASSSAAPAPLLVILSALRLLPSDWCLELEPLRTKSILICLVYVPQIRRQLPATILLLAQRNIRNQGKNMPTLILHRFFLSGQPWFRIEVPSYMDPDRLVVTLMPRSQEMHPGELYGTDWHCTLPVRLDLVSGNFIEHGIMLKSDAELLGHQLFIPLIFIGH